MKKYSIFALYLFWGEVAVRILGFCANAYVARVLNPEVYGFIIVGTSLLMYSLIAADGGLKTLGFIEAAKAPTNQIFSLTDIFFAKIVNGIIAFLLIAGFTMLFYEQKTLQLVCIFYLLNIFFEALFIDWYFKGIQKFKSLAIVRIVANSLYVAALFLFIKKPDQVIWIPLFFFIANMVSVVILLVLLPAKPQRISFTIQKYILILKHSIPLGLGALLHQITIYLPPLLLERMVNSRASGIFGAALKIVMLIMIFDKTFTTIFLSSLPRLWNKDKVAATKIVQSLLHFSLVFGFLVSLLLSISAPPIITLVFGNDYVESQYILAIISWFFLCTFLNSIFAYGLIAIDCKKNYLQAAIGGFIINCLLIPLATKFYGITGACVAMVIGEFLFVFLYYYNFRQFISVKLLIPLLKTGCAALGCKIVISFLDLHILMKYLVVLIIFSIFIILFKIITKTDLDLLKQQWRTR